MGLGDILSKIINGEGSKAKTPGEKDGAAPFEGNAPKSEGESAGGAALKETAVSQRGNPSDSAEAAEGESVSESEARAGSAPAGVTEEDVLEVLSGVYDPEIPIDIVNLGLIYGVEIADGNVHVRMTMTAPGCPASGEIASESKFLIEQLPGVKSAGIEIVWEPPWDPSKMSEEARLSMGF